MSGLPIIPPVCPVCNVACVYEASTPAVGSGFVFERHYCPVCGWKALGEFPVDDVTLDALEHALDARLTYNDEGELEVVGAEFSVATLLDFLSGHDPEKVVPAVDEEGYEIPGVFIYTGGQLYERDAVIRALIAEVRRLRTEDRDDRRHPGRDRRG